MKATDDRRWKSGMKAKILIVDDEPDIVETLKMRLEKSHYEVITAFDGLSAIAQAQEGKPGLILLDVMMPVIDGYHVCQKLKKTKETADIPVIMLTAAGEKDFRTRGLEAGAWTYVTKPYEAWDLLQKIENALRVRKHKSTRTEK